MAKIILTRHGHVAGIHPERFRGRMELALTELGRRQAAWTGARIAREWAPAAVYTSPLGRCRETGELIARACGLPASAVLEGLNDIDYGRWQWKTHAEVRAEQPALYELWRSAPHLTRFPAGESLQQLVSRAADALRDILARHAQETLVLVAHDSVNRALLLQLLEQPLSAYWRTMHAPCGISEIDIDAGQVQVRRMNETAHLLDLA